MVDFKTAASGNPSQYRVPFNYLTDMLSVKNIENFLSKPDTVLSNDEKGVKIILALENFNESEQLAWNDLQSAIGVNLPKYLGLSIFDPMYQHKFFTSPMVGLDAKDQPVLMIGTSRTEFDGTVHEPLQLPITAEATGDEDTPFKYKLGKDKQIFLTWVDRPDQTGTSFTFYIKGAGYLHKFGGKFTKDMKPETIKLAWETGDLKSVLAPFQGVGCKGTNFLQYAFVNGLFPQTGLFMVLENGQYKATDYKDEKGKVMKLESSHWRVVYVSHPDLPVYDWQSGDKKEIHELREVTLITFNWTNTIAPSARLREKPNPESAVIPRLYIHIRGMYPGHPDWTPQMSAVTNWEALSPVIKRIFPDIPQQLRLAPATAPEMVTQPAMSDADVDAIPWT